MYQYAAKIKKITKDDIIETEVDLGFDRKEIVRFRLFGVKLNGEKATEKLKKYIGSKTVMIQSMKNKKAKATGDLMYLCMIYLPQDNKSINQHLVAEGYANSVLE